MATKMIKKQVYLDEESAKALNEMTLQLGMSQAEVVRRSLVWAWELKVEKSSNESDPWEDVSGAIKGLPPGNYSQGIDGFIYGFDSNGD